MSSTGVDQEEKSMKMFAFNDQIPNFLLQKWWKSLKTMLKSTLTATALLVFSFLLLLSVLLLSGSLDLARYRGYSSREPPFPTSSAHKEPPFPTSAHKEPPFPTSAHKEPPFPTSSAHKTTLLEFPLDCNTWNGTNACPLRNPISQKFSHDPSTNSQACPEYFRWIHQDLRHWRQTGITREMVEKARNTAHFRLLIVDGRVYVERFRKSIQSRALFTMWGIVQLARLYPGRLPDLEIMFDSDDRPVVQEKRFRSPGSEPPPLFRYCSDWRSLDIVFPDWSFWGWAEINIKPWKSVLEEIKEGNKKTKWEDRVPYAYWRGNPHVAPWRGDLMRCNLTQQNDWNTRLYVQDWVAESQQGYKQSSLGDQCTHRYKIYIEGWAWSVSEKYILACDSPTLLMTLRWYDFFIRGMIPQHHYWPVRENDKCKSSKFAVEWGNNHTQKAKAIGEAGSRFIHEDLKMENVYDYMFHLLNEYAKLLKYKPTIPPNAKELCSESMACSADGNWRKFMEESLEKSPRDLSPCTLPPPYEPQEFKAFMDEKEKATREVEAWENEYYWNKQNGSK